MTELWHDVIIITISGIRVRELTIAEYTISASVSIHVAACRMYVL